MTVIDVDSHWEVSHFDNGAHPHRSAPAFLGDTMSESFVRMGDPLPAVPGGRP